MQRKVLINSICQILSDRAFRIVDLFAPVWLERKEEGEPTGIARCRESVETRIVALADDIMDWRRNHPQGELVL